MGGEQPVAVVEVPTEDRGALVERPPQPCAGGGLPGEHQRDPRPVARVPARRLAKPGRRLLKEGCQLIAVVNHTREADAEVGPSDVARVAQVAYGQVGMILHVPLVLPDQHAQGLLALCGQGEHMGVAVVLLAGGDGPRRSLLDDGCGDGSGESVRVDQSAPGERFPRALLCRHLDRIAVPGDLPRGGLQVQVRIDHGITYLKGDLNDCSDASRRLHMTDVRLESANHDGGNRAVGLREHGTDRGDLDQISQRRSQRMSFDVLDVAGFKQRAGEGRAHEGSAGCIVGNGEGAAAAVLPHRRTSDEGEDRVIVTRGVRQTFEHDHPATLAAGVAVRGVVEGLRPPVRGEQLGLRKKDMGPGVVDEVHPAAQGDPTLPTPQALDGEMQRHQ